MHFIHHSLFLAALDRSLLERHLSLCEARKFQITLVSGVQLGLAAAPCNPQRISAVMDEH